MELIHNRPVSIFLATTNAERCRAFYRDLLGLPELDDTEFALVYRLHSDTELRISKVENFTPHPFTVLDWQVAAIEPAMDTLKVSGIEFLQYDFMEQSTLGIWTAPGGTKIAWFKDPDNNVLSVSQRV